MLNGGWLFGRLLMCHRLFISDLDGTLLNTQGQLSEFAISELNRLIAAGVNFTIATARSPVNALELMQGVNLKLPIICHNGAVLHDPLTRTHQQVIAADSQVLQEVRNLLLTRGIAPLLAGVLNGRDYLYIEQPENEAVARYRTTRVLKNDPRLEPVEYSDFMAGEVIALNAIEREHNIRQLAADITHLDDKLAKIVYPDSYFDGWWWMTLSSPLASKAVGCQSVLDRLGIDRQSLIVFGDQENDLSMFSLAGKALAMSNAHPAVKSAASEMIGHCDENSVVRYIARVTGL